MTAMETDSKGIPIKGPYKENQSIVLFYTMMNVVFTSVFGTLYPIISLPREMKLQFLNLLF
jgi:hypothetical protein